MTKNVKISLLYIISISLLSYFTHGFFGDTFTKSSIEYLVQALLLVGSIATLVSGGFGAWSILLLPIVFGAVASVELIETNNLLLKFWSLLLVLTTGLISQISFDFNRYALYCASQRGMPYSQDEIQHGSKWRATSNILLVLTIGLIYITNILVELSSIGRLFMNLIIYSSLALNLITLLSGHVKNKLSHYSIDLICLVFACYILYLRT